MQDTVTIRITRETLQTVDSVRELLERREDLRGRKIVLRIDGSRGEEAKKELEQQMRERLEWIRARKLLGHRTENIVHAHA